MKTNATAVKYSRMVEEYTKAMKEVSKTFPVPHTYMFEEKTEQGYKNRILKTCYGVADVKVGDWVYYTHRVNAGGKKFLYIVNKVECDKVMSIGDEYCTMRGGDKPYLESIFAVYTGGAEMPPGEDVITNPIEIWRAIGELIADDSGEKRRVKTPDIEIIKDFNFEGLPRYELYTSIHLCVFGDGARMDERCGCLNITDNGRPIASFGII